MDWEHDDFRTGYTFATDFPLATLQARSVPPGVAFAGKPAETGGNFMKNVTESVEPVDLPKKSRKKVVGNSNA